MIDLTIIIPVYNVEDYLEECLDSVVQISDVSMQVICIDDCSTDSSYYILQRYREQYPIEIYVNEQNRGLAYTRNVGLQYAIGRYVMFVDSDDYINPSVISSFIKKMKSDELDLLYFDVEEFINGNRNIEVITKRKRKYSYPIKCGLDIFDLMVKKGEMFGCVWDGMYRKEFLSKHNLQFLDGILHEDIPFTFAALLNASKVGVMLETGYYYRQRSGSILHQPNYLKRARGLIIGYAQMICTWNYISTKMDLSEYESSINRYLDSIVSMIETNYLEGCSGDCEDAIVNHFMTNFRINTYRKLKEIVGSGLLQEMEKYKRVSLYGAGNIAKKVLPFLASEGIEVSAIFVTDIENNPNTMNGIPVLQYETKYGNEYDAIVVAVSQQLQKAIVDRLLELNYQGKIITLTV
ncbi:MAG: glycosyltransferase [Epulopiscium sp.]|nr:glycosyltransferase [Candidatus Epulonipiscium sp.]